MTIKEAFPLFVAYGQAERHYAQETLEKLKECFRCWILPNWGERGIESISRLDILAFRSKMVNSGVGLNRQYSILMVLKLFFKFCRNVLHAECLDPDREIQLPKRPEPHVHYLSNEEVERIKGAIQIHTFTRLRLRVLVEVLLGTGLRISEALSLDRTPFESGQNEIEIVGKGSKSRRVFFPAETLQWIKKFLYYRRDDFPAVFITTGIPRRLDRSDISKFFKQLRVDAGIDKPLTPHILRHTFCTNLLQNGADIRYIQELAGHADIQTTAKYYLGVDRQALRKVVDKFLNYKIPSPESQKSPSSI
jgi:integrase/recombinase XerD